MTATAAVAGSDLGPEALERESRRVHTRTRVGLHVHAREGGNRDA